MVSFPFQLYSAGCSILLSQLCFLSFPIYLSLSVGWCVPCLCSFISFHMSPSLSACLLALVACGICGFSLPIFLSISLSVCLALRHLSVPSRFFCVLLCPNAMGGGAAPSPNPQLYLKLFLSIEPHLSTYYPSLSTPYFILFLSMLPDGSKVHMMLQMRQASFSKPRQPCNIPAVDHKLHLAVCRFNINLSLRLIQFSCSILYRSAILFVHF